MPNSIPTSAAASSRWHACEADAVLAHLDATVAGLTTDAADQRLRQYGANRLPEPQKPGAFRRFLRQFHNILIYVLLGSATITLVLEHIADTLVILAVVLANAVIGFLQEGKAEKAMDAIRGMLAPQASVLRDGARCRVAGEALVPGDVVVLEAGDKVPADLRLLEAHGLSIQEALLTGESVPAEKQPRPVAADAALGDRFCMAFSGTLVTSGQAKGIVVATGPATEIGRISGLLSQVETLATPLVRHMQVFARQLTVVILLGALALLAFGHLVAGHLFEEILMVVVGLSVAAIPEGLPAVLTITLAVGVQVMARRHVIVRRLPAIETLGAVSVICTDKTGTLTRNEMTVAGVQVGERFFQLEGDGYTPSGIIRCADQAVNGPEQAALYRLAQAACLCNDAALQELNGVWTVSGDPMEGALLSFAGKAGIDLRQEPLAWTRTDAIPFDARHRFMATLHHDHRNHAFIFVKGAPEQVLEMCSGQLAANDTTAALDRTFWQTQANDLAAQGQRVLALAVRAVSPQQTVLEFMDVEGTLTLLGLVALIDPPRPEAIAAIAECHQAGIQVKMITGDHAGTAMAIGRQIGLAHPDRVLTGADLEIMDDAALRQAVLETDIFARTSPEHKLRLVTALQSHGLIVAMTGDGVNDAPALKRADAGIAMGRTGSEAAKEAAELVLLDDNFASIVAAVREGRTVYDNLKKVISWTLPTNAGEAIVVIFALLLGLTLPVTPIQILWINLITAITLGLALAFEPTEVRTMQRPPRPVNAPLLTGTLVWHIALVSLLFLCGVYAMYFYATTQGYSIELTRTLAVNTIVVMQVFQLFFIRNLYSTSLTWKAVRGTPVVWLTVGIVAVAQLAITYLPPFQRIFATESVPVGDGLLILGAGLALFAIIETEKQIRLRVSGQRKSRPRL